MTARTRSKASSAAAQSRSKPRSKAGRAGKSERYNYGREFMLTSLGCLWIILATGLIGICGGAYYGSTLAVNVLKEIGAHDYAGPRERIQRYENFFASLDPSVYQVDKRQQNVDQGKVSVSWVVTLRGSQERRRFQWENDLQAYTVTPKTNPALCLDVELGLMTEADAAAFTELETERARYDAEDLIVRSIVKSNYSLAQVQDMESGWQLPTEEPVGAPLISAEAGKDRQHAKTEEELEETEAGGGEEQPAEPNDATSVIGSSSDDGDSDGG